MLDEVLRDDQPLVLPEADHLEDVWPAEAESSRDAASAYSADAPSTTARPPMASR